MKCRQSGLESLHANCTRSFSCDFFPEISPYYCRPYGYFFYATVDEALQAGFPTSSALYVAPRAILKCMAWGEIPVPSTGNHAKSLVFTQVRPVEVLDVPLGAKNVQFSRRELTGIKLACARQIFPPFTAATGRNSMPLHRSSADERALSHNVVLMVRCNLFECHFTSPVEPFFFCNCPSVITSFLIELIASFFAFSLHL